MAENQNDKDKKDVNQKPEQKPTGPQQDPKQAPKQAQKSETHKAR